MGFSSYSKVTVIIFMLHCMCVHASIFCRVYMPMRMFIHQETGRLYMFAVPIPLPTASDPPPRQCAAIDPEAIKAPLIRGAQSGSNAPPAPQPRFAAQYIHKPSYLPFPLKDKRLPKCYNRNRKTELEIYGLFTHTRSVFVYTHMCACVFSLYIYAVI